MVANLRCTRTGACLADGYLMENGAIMADAGMVGHDDAVKAVGQYRHIRKACAVAEMRAGRGIVKRITRSSLLSFTSAI